MVKIRDSFDVRLFIVWIGKKKDKTFFKFSFLSPCRTPNNGLVLEKKDKLLAHFFPHPKNREINKHKERKNFNSEEMRRRKRTR